MIKTRYIIVSLALGYLFILMTLLEQLVGISFIVAICLIETVQWFIVLISTKYPQT